MRRTMSAALLVDVLLIPAGAWAQAPIPGPSSGGGYATIVLDGSFSNPGDICRAVAISSQNEIVVNTERQAEWPPAPRWAVVVRINAWGGSYVTRKLAPAQGFTHTFARGINAFGIVVGQSMRWTPSFAQIATVWDANGNPYPISGGDDAIAINNLGKVAVYVAQWGVPPFVLDINTGIRAPLQMGSYLYSQPTSINNVGAVAGIAAYGGPQLAYQPCAWSPCGGMGYLGNFVGQINGINDRSTMVGAVHANGVDRPAMWIGGQCIVPSLPSGATSGMLAGVNTAGTSTGFITLNGKRVGVMWNNRPSFLPQPGTLKQWECLALNDGGLAVGDGFDGWGVNTHAVVWIPVGRF